MKIGQFGHLTYCTNIHPGESWQETKCALLAYLPQVRRRLALVQPMGIGLRLSQAAAATLAANEEERRSFKSFLADNEFYVFTINGFPYGNFHRTRVKDSVYLPDWRDESRLAYTDLLAELLIDMLPDGVSGSISTVGLAYRAHLKGGNETALMTDLLIRHAAHLHALREKTGKLVVLALEPEPGCLLESTADVVGYFAENLHGKPAAERFSMLTGLDCASSMQALHLHLGLCLDICHAVVGFEDPVESISTLRRAGINVHKVQLSAGIRVVNPGSADLKFLAPFADDVYLHQLAARTGNSIAWWPDLPDALDDERARLAEEWRIHYHVPLWTEPGEQCSTTARAVADVLALHRHQPVAPHLEIETYTWDVLGRNHHGFDLATSIAKEMKWVLAQLA